MKIMKISKISDSEKDIMNIIWAKENPVTANDIMKSLQKEKQWKITTVLTFLSRLVDKGILSSVKKGKTNFYSADISSEGYSKYEAKTILDESYNGSLKSFMTALYHGGGITKSDLDDLKKWLDEQE